MISSNHLLRSRVQDLQQLLVAVAGVEELMGHELETLVKLIVDVRTGILDPPP